MDKFRGKTTDTDSRRGRKSKYTYNKLKRVNNEITYQKQTRIRWILWCNLPLNQMFIKNWHQSSTNSSSKKKRKEYFLIHFMKPLLPSHQNQDITGKENYKCPFWIKSQKPFYFVCTCTHISKDIPSRFPFLLVPI